MTNTNGTHLPSYSVEYYYMKHWIIMYMNVQTFLLYTLEQRQVLLCYNHKIRTIKLSMGNIHTIHIYLRRKFECWYSKYAGAFVYNPQRKCKEKFLFLVFLIRNIISEKGILRFQNKCLITYRLLSIISKWKMNGSS